MGTCREICVVPPPAGPHIQLEAQTPCPAFAMLDTIEECYAAAKELGYKGQRAEARPGSDLTAGCYMEGAVSGGGQLWFNTGGGVLVDPKCWNCQAICKTTGQTEVGGLKGGAEYEIEDKTTGPDGTTLKVRGIEGGQQHFQAATLPDGYVTLKKGEEGCIRM